MLVSEKYYRKKVLLLNFVLSCLIVTIHSIVPERYGVPISDYPFVHIVVLLCKVATPTFFFLSAVLFYRKCRFADLERKLTRRVYSLLIPFFLWNAFFVALYWILTHLPILSDMIHTSPISSSPKDILLAIWNSEHTDLWFIRNLMTYIVMAPVVLLLLKNKKIAILVYAVTLIYVLTNGVGHYELITWVPIYLLGAMFGYYGWSEQRITSRQSVFLFPLIFIIVYLLVYFGELNLKVLRNVSPVLIWLMMDALLYRFIDEKLKPKAWLGYTFFIYATHHFVLNILQKVVVVTLPPTQLVVNLTFVITPLITIYMLIKVVDVIKDSLFYRVMCGRRK